MPTVRKRSSSPRRLTTRSLKTRALNPASAPLVDLPTPTECDTKLRMLDGTGDVHRRLNAALDSLGDLEQLALLKRFFANGNGDGADPVETAARAQALGISPDELENVEADALRKLRGGKHQKVRRPTNQFN